MKKWCHGNDGKHMNNSLLLRLTNTIINMNYNWVYWISAAVCHQRKHCACFPRDAVQFSLSFTWRYCRPVRQNTHGLPQHGEEKNTAWAHTVTRAAQLKKREIWMACPVKKGFRPQYGKILGPGSGWCGK